MDIKQIFIDFLKLSLRHLRLLDSISLPIDETFSIRGVFKPDITVVVAEVVPHIFQEENEVLELIF